GPEVEYANRPVTYTARVTNTGNVDARNVRLALFAADGVSVANVSEPRPSTNAVSAGSGQGSQPTAAVRTAAAEGSETEPRGVRQAAATNGNRANQDQQATNEVGSWDLGNLPKGETREVRYTVRPRGLKVIHQRAVAQYVCAPTENDRRAVEAVATTQTEIISLPALHISTTDEVDPVKVGEEAVYTIVVENQGTAPDEQI